MPIRLRCPDCNALMQVADQAAGRRTQCPGCKKVVQVPANAANTGGGPQSGAPAVPPPTRATPSAVPTGAGKTGAGMAVPSQPANIPPSPVGPQPVQVRCPKCQQAMRANPGTTVQCPHCRTAVKIAAPGSPLNAPPSSRPTSVQSRVGQPFSPPANDPFADLPASYPTGGAGFGAPQPYRPPAQYSAPKTYSAPAGYSGGSNPRAVQYAILGSVFCLLGGLMVLGVIANFISAIIYFLGEDKNDEMTVRAIGGIVGGLLISLPIGILYIRGGINFFTRNSLGAARTAAIIAIIPCFSLCIFTPFGIWGTILTGSEAAKRDFAE